MDYANSWKPDPFGLHELRFFSADGRPTPLVMDAGKRSFDRPPATDHGSSPAEPPVVEPHVAAPPVAAPPVVAPPVAAPPVAAPPVAAPPVAAPHSGTPSRGTPSGTPSHGPQSRHPQSRHPQSRHPQSSGTPVAAPRFSEPATVGGSLSESSSGSAETSTLTTSPHPTAVATVALAARHVTPEAEGHPSGSTSVLVEPAAQLETARAYREPFTGRQSELSQTVAEDQQTVVLSRPLKIAYAVVLGLLALSVAGVVLVHVAHRSNPTVTQAASVTTTTTTVATTTTTVLPTALSSSAQAAATALVSSWSVNNRTVALTVATPAAVNVLFGVPYTSGQAIARGCSTSFTPIVCTYGPPGGASPSDPIYQIRVSQTSGGWYVSSVKKEN